MMLLFENISTAKILWSLTTRQDSQRLVLHGGLPRYGVAVSVGVAVGASAVPAPGALVLVGGRVAVGVTILTGMTST